ncbi:MAG: Flp pilus assembly complex ATPase component TadA [Candidatus Omnitrophica bacterium]|nr:Flp pilus assembly complex ATPase component TadA [Candidatus Omnitrophota bacterium]
MLKIGKILQDAGLVTAGDIEAAVEIQRQNGKYLGEILIEMGKITEESLLECLSRQMNIPYVRLRSAEIPREAIEKMPVKFVWHYKIMPVRYENNILTVAISDPLNTWPLDGIKMQLKTEIDTVLSTSGDISEAMHRYYGVGSETVEKILSKEEEKRDPAVTTLEPVEDIEKLAGDASVVQLVNQILVEAIHTRATDVHFEPYDKELVVRYRVDGVLQPAKVSDDIRYLYKAIVARIKIMTGLDMVERRLPQSGGTRVRLENRQFDLRVSVIPDAYGEGVVIRVLPTEMLMSLEHLGMSPEDLKLAQDLIAHPHGLVFVTGPTGSGKTTTLYACLSRLNQPNVKIITVEDPVEYKLRFVEQIQVHTKAGLTFSQVLRSVLRHDPDIIMVGEVRDHETAEIAVQASLTGHLVLSTLHTNDAAGAVTRLLDMQIEPYLVSSTVLGVVAQRLVRKVCPHCAKDQPWDPSGLPAVLRESIPGPELQSVKRAVGCDRCRQSGYQGRLAIYEILPFTPEIHELVIRRASAGEVKKVACAAGMRTLFQSGWEKIRQGDTTPEELLRVVQTA